MEILANKTHYLSFYYPTTGLPLSQWTTTLKKNGVERPDIPVSLQESPPRHYTFYFTNDGTHNSVWDLCVTPIARPSVHYNDTWLVRKNVVEQTVLEMATEAVTGDAGFSARK